MEKMRRTLLIAVCLVVSVALAVFSGSMCTVEGANPQHGAISICFDDGKRNQFDNAFQLMKARGIVGTFYIITDGIRDFSGNEAYMSVAELQTLQAYGNEIGSHTKTHPALAGLSSSTIREECYASKQLLQSYGLTVNNIAYPYGSTDSTVDATASEYYRSGRYAYTTEFIMYFPISQFNLFALAGETDDASALPRLKSMVDQVYSANGWGAIFF